VTAPFTIPEGATFTYRDHPVGNGERYRFKMPNGFGASVVRFSGSYGGDHGLWELAVTDAAGNLTYDTPITSDVIGWLTEDGVSGLLADIAALERKP
jgi:hypothetical protein